MDKCVLITGASSGIGKELSAHYKLNGYKVINLSRQANCEWADLNVSCDLKDEKNIIEAFKEVKKFTKRINVLINNAGYGVSGASEFVDINEAKEMFDVNVFGVMATTKCALPMMGSGDRIINISSVLGLFPAPFRGWYAASKSAVISLSSALYMECKYFNVDVVTICPSEIKTNFSKNRRKTLTTNERYGNSIQNAAQTIDKNENKRKDPVKAVNKIYKWCTKKHPKPLYIMSAKFKLLYFFERFVPHKTFLNLTYKYFGGKK